jgi:hypothetical protein
MSFLDSNARDKLVILGLIALGFGCLGGVYFGRMELKEGVMIVITALAAAFKGNPTVSPAPPSSLEQPAPPPTVPTHPLGGASQPIQPTDAKG